MASAKIELSGSAESHFPPERGVLTIQVRCKVPDQAASSLKLEQTATLIQNELRLLAGRNADDPEPDVSGKGHGQDGKAQSEDAAITRWSSSAMLTMIHHEIEYIDPRGIASSQPPNPFLAGTSLFGGSAAPPASMGNTTARNIVKYSASITLTARFRDFTKLAEFTTALARVEHVTVTGVHWILTSETLERVRLEMIEKAYTNALKKAQTFARAMGQQSVKPVSVIQRPHGVHGGAIPFGGGALFGSTNAHAGAPPPSDEKSQTLAFVPQDIAVHSNCECVFVVE